MRKLLLLMSMCLCMAHAWSQIRLITGKVTDEKGAELEGASITAKGTKVSTFSKEDGTFTLQVPAGVKFLVVTYIGADALEIPLTNANFVNVLVNRKGGDPLDEIVVVGYQQKKRRDEGGAISSVKAAQLENLPNVSLDKALQGKAAGVLVQSNNGIPGGAINVRIRGQGSLNAGNDPLFIIDGVQLNTRNDGAFTQSNPLSFLNPDDIESIDILKDAASAAIYGSSAANGVVIVTTKKGKAGKTKFNANVNFGSIRPLKKLDVLNAQEYFQLRSEAYGTNLNTPANSLAVKRTVLNELRVAGATGFSDQSADSAIAAFKTYDWQDAAFENSSLQTYELSAAGGNDKTTFRTSASYTKQGTIVTKADFRRAGLKLDLSNKATDRLTISTSLNLTTFEQNVPFSTDGSFLGSPAFSASGIIPTNPIYNADGTFYGMPGNTPANLVGTLNQNIIAVNEYNTGYGRTNSLIGNGRVMYKVANWLNYVAQVNLDYRLVQGRQVRDARTADAFVRKGLVNQQSTWNTNVASFQTLNYNFTLNEKNRIDGLVGFEYRRESQEATFESGDGFPTYQFNLLSNAANPLSVGEVYTTYRRNSAFANLNYYYSNKYYVSANFRYDGSSRFGKNKKYGPFYGILGSWNIDKEDFLKNSKVISALKLRATYGSIGNDQIGNFDGLGLYSGSGIYNGSAGISYNNLANPNLSWERSTQLNFGLDFGLFNNRISGTVEVYNKINSNVLISQPLQSTTGFQSFTSNVGKIQNKGVELTLNVDWFRETKHGDFSWNTNFIMGYVQNKVKELYGGVKILPGDNSIQVGQPLGVLFTQKYAGVNPATGRPMWYDTLGNLTYTVQARDRVLFNGSTRLPKFQGGLRNTFSYKNFTLDVFFQYQYGQYAQDLQSNFLLENIGRINALQEVYDNRWTTPGQVTWYPRFNTLGAESKGSGAQSGSRTWFKADYIRLKNVMLSYSFEPSLLYKLKINSAKIYLQGTNLATISKWYSYDVEFVTTALGIVPQNKNFTLGLQLGF